MRSHTKHYAILMSTAFLAVALLAAPGVAANEMHTETIPEGALVLSVEEFDAFLSAMSTAVIDDIDLVNCTPGDQGQIRTVYAQDNTAGVYWKGSHLYTGGNWYEYTVNRWNYQLKGGGPCVAGVNAWQIGSGTYETCITCRISVVALDPALVATASPIETVVDFLNCRPGEHDPIRSATVRDNSWGVYWKGSHLYTGGYAYTYTAFRYNYDAAGVCVAGANARLTGISTYELCLTCITIEVIDIDPRLIA